MSLIPRQKVGPYEIVSVLGAGGMGEVYRARDPRLGRDVAIKVLPASFSADADRLHRFEQEARAAAALNHPNILAVYDIGTHEGAPYIVSELLEGETLRVPESGLPVRKAVEYGLQIARGLAAAHEKGIVHRDLKPLNIFVTTDSRVKILDFGLAKLTQNESAVEGPTVLPTSPAVNTQAGMVLGTMGYMAPEQVRGLPADHRADIFAFGVVLYEMLSGRRAFQGATSADTMIAIVKEDPADLPVAERHISPALERIVDRCLEKSPNARFQTAADMAFALESLSSQSDRTATGAALPAASPTRGSRERLAWMTAAALGLALAITGAVSVLHLREAAPVEQSVQFEIRLPAGSSPVAQAPLEISPDGQQVIFGAIAQGISALWVRPLSGLEARRLPGTEGAAYPFWSHDSRSVAFFADGRLKKVLLAGGPPTVLCDAPNPLGGTWSQDGTILFSPAVGLGIQKINGSTGGTPVAVTTLAKGESGHRWPSFLPDSRHFLFLAVDASVGGSGESFVGSLDSAERTTLGRMDSNAVYSSNHLLFSRGGVLVAQPFDAARRQLTGEAFPIANEVDTVGASRRAPFSASPSGVLGYRSGSLLTALTWFDRTGKVTGTVGDRSSYLNLALSPDGRRLAVSQATSSTRNIDIWIFDFERPGSPTRLTTDPAAEFDPTWSPDGSHVLFSSTRTGPLDLYRHAANGSGQDERVLETRAGGPEYSADGKFLAFTSGPDMWVWPLASGGKAYPLMKTQFQHGSPAISPDSRWIAYATNETGVSQIYVQAFPGLGTKSRISEAGGAHPRWSGDGRELFFLEPGGIMTVAGIDTAAGFRVTPPKALFSTGIAQAGNNHPYIVTKDGQHFLVARNADPDLSPMTVTLNWLAGVGK